MNPIHPLMQWFVYRDNPGHASHDVAYRIAAIYLNPPRFQTCGNAAEYSNDSSLSPTWNADKAYRSAAYCLSILFGNTRVATGVNCLQPSQYSSDLHYDFINLFSSLIRTHSLHFCAISFVHRREQKSNLGGWKLAKLNITRRYGMHSTLDQFIWYPGPGSTDTAILTGFSVQDTRSFLCTVFIRYTAISDPWLICPSFNLRVCFLSGFRFPVQKQELPFRYGLHTPLWRIRSKKL